MAQFDDFTLQIWQKTVPHSGVFSSVTYNSSSERGLVFSVCLIIGSVDQRRFLSELSQLSRLKIRALRAPVSATCSAGGVTPEG